MAFAFPGDFSLDYFPCQYGASKLVFRGPKHSLRQPYSVAIGGTETYGKFVPEPYSVLLAQLTGRSVVNFGYMNAGPDVFLHDPEVLDIAAHAELTIVQIVGAQNLSNRYYTVHPRRNDRFLRASVWLQKTFREVDFTDFHFTRHMLQSLYEVSPQRFREVAAELQATWVARMQLLLQSLKGPTLLLWMADRPPPAADAAMEPYSNPVLINAAMIDQVRGAASAYLEVVTSQQANDEGVDQMAFSAMDRAAAEGVPGPRAHREVAEAIADATRQLFPK
ncbi:hypothetical protein EGN72_10870 [Pseudorhodobacter sp. E13]|uniref:DUF6473 family protein n=1 Tax=Pseudorhodobacter sp. E13 TaxID=2487931 RepID=UPI000F8DAD94|nr:DUF6473 family protein [Pseudorhodobacter sp. E13]RUS60278.1 hypothetical protein EGN72_10870 [Pseudorhodobacter sp. E13]